VRGRRYARVVHEVRAAVAGTIVEIDVDEGQLVAEADVIGVIRSSLGDVVVEVDVPGVVRELHVEVGDDVAMGALLALIDES
jgi:multidrug efflux pump subunit AcrA (membrane-fusion protein)